MQNLVKVKDSQFGSMICDYYGDGTGDFYMTRQQIGQALEYSNPNKDIDSLHRRHKDRLDKFSTTVTLRVVEGNRKVKRKMLIYSAKGVYEICRWSRQPKADEFYDHVYEILEGLRLGYLKLSVEQNSQAWIDQRSQSKLTRNTETDVIQKLVEYARGQGYDHEDKLLYMNYSRLANKMTGITDRDTATLQQLNELTFIENIILNQIRIGMVENLHYKEIYRACKRQIELFRNVAYLG